MRTSLIISISYFLLCTAASAQPPQISIASDIGLQRNFRQGQQFNAFGHTVQTQFHITATDGLYIWLSYYTNGKFNNDLSATAKSALTLPPQISYRNNAMMRFRQYSMGYHKYLKGRYNAEQGWSLYGYAGLGILFGRVENKTNIKIDTSLYNLPVRIGIAKFKRLTLDLGLGYEVPIGGDLFFFTEGRVWIPTTDYPSKYIFVNQHAPLVGMLNAGIRVLF